MALLACIIPAVSWICQPLLNAMQGSLGTAAQSCFSFLSDWVVGEFNRRRTAVMEVPASTASIVGAEETLSEIKTHLHDEQVGIIGIYGMGGVGKTTLLQKINNDFFESGTQGMFDLVIWATISKEINVLQIQKQIIERLGKSESAVPSSEVERAKLLFQALSHKRFLLLLDDVWERLDLATIGIPDPKGRRNCKIAFTTRSRQVCSDMDSDQAVRVNLLDETRSWELFCSKLRTQVVLNKPSVRELAKQVVHKCGGLPLALVTVGKAMANRALPYEWEHAMKSLNHYAEQLRGMDQVLSCLKFSFDRLETDQMRSALLFCAMYPEDKDIQREEIIEYWFGEGLLDTNVDDHIDHARNRGHVLISDLQDACMLESGIEDAEKTIRMHDAVRDMALWLNNRESEKVDKFRVLDRKNLNQLVTSTEIREHVRRIWMRDLDSRISPCISDFPNITTLLLGGVQPKPVLLQGFFTFMRTLRVLDLSNNQSLTELPVEIGSLAELQYLNLNYNREIGSLPVELGNLVRLRVLQLGWTPKLRRIPQRAIVGLSSLQVLNMMDCGYDWDTHGKMTTMQVTTVEETNQQLQLSDLESLSRLQQLHVKLCSSRALRRVLSSNMLCECTTHLSVCKANQGSDDDDLLYGEGGTLLPMPFERMCAHLRYICLSDDQIHPWMGKLQIELPKLPRLERMDLLRFSGEMRLDLVGTDAKCSSSKGSSAPSSFQSFRHLQVWNCPGLKELRFVGSFMCLEEVNMYICNAMEELVLDGDFPMLKIMKFETLKSLRCIGPQPLLLPSLERIRVRWCPALVRLPLGPSSAPKLQEITGGRAWWDALEWPTNNLGDTRSIYEPFVKSPFL